MGESLHCDLCGKPATVHLTQIVKNQIQKVDLCEECAQSKGVTDPEGFSLADLLSKSFAGPADDGAKDDVDPTAMVCEQCGSSAKDFKKSGRLGCAACYEAMKPVLMPLIAGLHKGSRHKGKAPARQWRRLELGREIESLERQLLEAVKDENFESAARCRDQLGSLKAKLCARRHFLGPLGFNRQPLMQILPILDTPAEVVPGGSPTGPIVLSTRIRLARNLRDFPFPGWAKEAQRREIFTRCIDAANEASQMKKAYVLDLSALDDLEKTVLVERHLISRELSGATKGAGVVISRDQTMAVMVNEEDHLRIQVMRPGFQFKRVWKQADALDNSLEEKLDLAFSPELGYLTACPTNVGTGLRASVMMHLPGLVLNSQMEQVIRAVNTLGLAVRGWYGEGSEASGSIFQISNQQTLGESEEDIIKRVTSVLQTIVEQEQNARAKLLENDSPKLLDKIGRAYGTVRNAHLLTSVEAMNCLSLLRLAADLGLLAEAERPRLDRLFIESQPGHVQLAARGTMETQKRDLARARFLREQLAALPALNFDRAFEKN